MTVREKNSARGVKRCAFLLNAPGENICLEKQPLFGFRASSFKFGWVITLNDKLALVLKVLLTGKVVVKVATNKYR